MKSAKASPPLISPQSERESLLAAIVEYSADAIIRSDLKGNIASWNRGAEEIFGYAVREAMGRPLTMLSPSGESVEVPEMSSRVRRGETLDHYETAQLAKEGRRLAVSLTVSPLRNGAGTIVGAVRIARDITDRHRAHERLRDSEARFRAATTAISSLIWTNNASGHMEGEQLDWSAFTGQTRDEYQGYGWAAAVHPDDSQKTVEAWNEAVAAKRTFMFEHRLRRHDGVYRLFGVRAAPVLDETGSIREWVGVHTDITEAQKMIEERAQALEREQRSRETAELLNRVGRVLTTELDPQILAQTITDLATQIVGAEFGCLFHNVKDDSGESYLLYTISGVPRERFSHFPMPRKTQVFAPTFTGQAIVRSDDITKDPRYGHNAPYHGMPEGHLPVRSHLAVPVISRSGAVLGGLFFGHQHVGIFTARHEELLVGIAAQAAIALDNARLFTESQKAREALTAANRELQRVNADLEQFAYAVSHDLRAPLRQIVVYNQLLQRRYEGKLDAKADEFLRLSVEGTGRMDKLVTGLLEYTQAVIAGEADSRPTPANVVFDQALANLRSVIEETSAAIECGPLPLLKVQHVHLLQIFQNLLGNALKYRSLNRPRIQVGAAPAGNLWRLTVSDNGIGIAREHRDEIFGLFKRLHGAGEYPGNGIGLALCHKVVERYGGHIWMESDGPGKGSTFFLTLPGEPPQPEQS